MYIDSKKAVSKPNMKKKPIDLASYLLRKFHGKTVKVIKCYVDSDDIHIIFNDGTLVNITSVIAKCYDDSIGTYFKDELVIETG